MGAIRSAPADTSQFSVGYCTALPSLVLAQWERDYARYERFLTPEIKRTQQGIISTSNGVRTWWCQPSASPHAQLDTATLVRDPRQLIGEWHSVANRFITHIDSFSVADQKMYRSASARDVPTPVALAFTDSKLRASTSGPKPEQTSKKYALINQRYLLTYGLMKGGGVSLVGLDAAGRLVVHSCAVTERRVSNQYLTYETVINQLICERGQ